MSVITPISLDMQVTCQCGVPLQDLDDMLREQGLTTGHSPQSKPLAQMGGLVATRSIGQFSTLYGGIEDMVVGLEVVFPNGKICRIKNVPRRAVGPDIRHIVIGNEGALCYITEVTVKMFKYQPNNNVFMIPDPPEDASALIYLEIGGTEDAVEELAGTLMELADARGSDADEAWAVTDDAGITAARSYRHASAESANLFVEEARRTEPAITKLGTDISFPGRSFGEIVGIYENGLKENGLKGCIFGHISEPCPHVNILAKDIAEYEKGTALLREWSKKFWETDRAAAPEHGIGKLKRRFLCEESLSGIRKKYRDAKTELDPDNCCNRGDVFPEGERFR